MFQPGMFGNHQNFLQNMENENGKSIIATEDDFDNKSGNEMEAHSGGEEDQDPSRRPKKKRYHRHTQHQIQEMECFFKECPHPDDKQRKELSRELGLEPLQIKFWFQNKRTQMKAQFERHENQQLKNDNDKLRADHMRLKEQIANATCPQCGGPKIVGEMSFEEQHLRVENARLQDEIDQMVAMAAKFGKQMIPYAQPQPHPLHMPSSRSIDLAVGNFGPHPGLTGSGMYGANSLLQPGPTDMEKSVIIELAVAAMEELICMAHAGEPLWIPSAGTEVLKQDEYLRTLPRAIGPRPLGLKSEASRETGAVIMNHVNLVEVFMDVNQWKTMFGGVVSRAMTLDVLSTGVGGNYNGALQVIVAEFQVPSPLVPSRDYYFARYIKQHGDGTWAVVDVSLDNLRHGGPIPRSQRRPSGCLIQEMANGYSKVTWVEHVEVNESDVHPIYKLYLNSSLAFGAKRWLATLDRQCERLATAMSCHDLTGYVGVTTTSEGKKSMMKLAERMVMSFYSGVGASTAQAWTLLSPTNVDNVRVMTRKSMDDPGKPPGIVLSASTSFWIPVPPKRLFDFLRDEKTRNEWDILSNGGLVQEMAHISNGRDPGNNVTLLRVNMQSQNSNQSNMLILQESCCDPTGSYVIYAPVDIGSMNAVLNGGDPDYVALLPSGFAILPDGPPGHNVGGIHDIGSGGSLLSVAFQILVDSVPTAKLSLGSVATVNSLIKCTVERIRASVTGDTA